ncbi:MAG: hypothetical protein H2172_05220 [Opitutus sp.]|nr:hypothetical protein [Opitutus sp.]MCS6278925.1 hypothetical protein [Opitutus sp.]MCS6298675.1 hypothetical protein [Opitutus sp.]
MPPFLPPEKAHPEGESENPDHKATPSDAAEVLIVDTPGGRFRAQFAPELPVSPLGVSGERESVYFWRLGMHFFFGGSSSP